MDAFFVKKHDFGLKKLFRGTGNKIVCPLRGGVQEKYRNHSKICKGVLNLLKAVTISSNGTCLSTVHDLLLSVSVSGVP